MAIGTNSFWMNVFTDIPQVLGCCEQSVINPENRIADYTIAKGYNLTNNRRTSRCCGSRRMPLVRLRSAARIAANITKIFDIHHGSRAGCHWYGNRAMIRIYRVPERGNWTGAGSAFRLRGEGRAQGRYRCRGIAQFCRGTGQPGAADFRDRWQARSRSAARFPGFQ